MRIRGISTGLYGWMERFARDGITWDWDSLYGACAESGVDAVETDALPEKLAIARAHGLRISASYVGIPLHLPIAELDIDTSVLPYADRLAAAGGSDLVLNADQADWSNPVEKTADDAKRQGANLALIAERVRGLGLSVSLHNHAHDSAGAALDLASVIEHSSDEVGLFIDAGWAAFAGHDPIEWVRRYPTRVRGFHLRNMADRLPTESVDEGELDIPALIAAADDAGFTGWLTLELWHPEPLQPSRTMVEDTRRSADYLRGLVAARLE
jgi:inosose dehydratase